VISNFLCLCCTFHNSFSNTHTTRLPFFRASPCHLYLPSCLKFCNAFLVAKNYFLNSSRHPPFLF
jgi:hypothetical protein